MMTQSAKRMILKVLFLLVFIPTTVQADTDYYDQIEAIREQLSLCKSEVSKSIECCNDPLQCVTGIPGLGMGILTIAQLFAFQQKPGNEGGIAQQCELYKHLGYTVAGITGAVGAFCGAQKIRCDNSCKETHVQLEGLLEECERNSGSDRWKECGELRHLRIKASNRIDTCSQLNANISINLQSAIYSFASAKQAELCEEMAKDSTSSEDELLDDSGPTIPPPIDPNDCSHPANATSPICRMNCQRPGAANDPLCQLRPPDKTLDGPDTGFQDSHSNSDDELDLSLMENDPQSVIPEVAPEHLGIAGQGGGGGSVGRAPSGGFGGGGANPGRESNGKKGKGHNTNILKGHRSQTGFSRKYGSSGGGFSGYGSSRQSSKSDSYPAFDLKSFLPGGKKDPKRKVALQKAQQIGAKHTDIWQKITLRYQGACQIRHLKDCRGKQ